MCSLTLLRFDPLVAPAAQMVASFKDSLPFYATRLRLLQPSANAPMARESYRHRYNLQSFRNTVCTNLLHFCRWPFPHQPLSDHAGISIVHEVSDSDGMNHPVKPHSLRGVPSPMRVRIRETKALLSAPPYSRICLPDSSTGIQAQVCQPHSLSYYAAPP